MYYVTVYGQGRWYASKVRQDVRQPMGELLRVGTLKECLAACL